jgi:hypothetical protein
MMACGDALATPFACAGIVIVLTEGMRVAARRLLRKARNLPQAVRRLAEGLLYSFAWWLADGLQGLRHHPREGQHCTHGEPSAVLVGRPAPLRGPFPPAPRPPDASESMTPLSDDTAVQLALVQPYTEQAKEWE